MKLDEDGLRRDSVHLRDTTDKRRQNPYMWFYEERDGIYVVAATTSGWLKLSDIIAYLKRKGLAVTPDRIEGQ